MPIRHRERHGTEHIGWLRAAVLGANDGILSTASLVLGSRRRMGLATPCWSLGSPGWSRALCRWLLVSTCLSTRRPILNKRTSA